MGRKINHKGLLGTIIFHSIIAAILLLLGFHTPLPLPEEKGILISFGDTPQGGGNTAASKPVRKNKPKTKKTEQKAKYKKPVVKEEKSTPKPAVSKPKVTKAQPAKKLLTQNHEDAPAIKSSNAQKKAEALKKKQAQERIKKQKEAKRRKQEKARQQRLEKERQQKLEQDRIKRQQEAERKAEEARKKKELEEKRKEEERRKKFAQSMNSRAKNLFGKSNTPKSGNGNTSKTGNQGKKSGSTNGNINGTGSGNSGISYNLRGRNAEYLHLPKINFSKGGKVVVEVIVDKNGKVVRATPGAIGTTTTNQNLYNIAKQSALKTRFNTSAKAPQHQKGTITYIFIVK